MKTFVTLVGFCIYCHLLIDPKMSSKHFNEGFFAMRLLTST